jgi:hypothetical protein
VLLEELIKKGADNLPSFAALEVGAMDSKGEKGERMAHGRTVVPI